MSLETLSALRLRSQLLAHDHTLSASRVLAHFGAIQAQDYASAKLALALRSQSTEAAIEQALQQRQIARSWLMRGTLHLTPAADLRWIQQLIGPHVLKRNVAMYRQLGLDAAVLDKACALIHAHLLGGKTGTREELLGMLERHGLQTDGHRGGHILYHAAHSGLICLGEMQGRFARYVLVEEWLCDTTHHLPPSPEAALAELARRYFCSHGPATQADFAWWSGLPASESRIAVSEAAAHLESLDINGVRYWHAPGLTPLHTQDAWLLPAFDEFFLGYADRSVSTDAQQVRAVMTVNGIFRPTLLVGDRILGVWERKLGKQGIDVRLSPFAPLPTDCAAPLQDAAARYARCVESKVTLA